jgi:hypothetical protein
VQEAHLIFDVINLKKVGGSILELSPPAASLFQWSGGRTGTISLRNGELR